MDGERNQVRRKSRAEDLQELKAQAAELRAQIAFISAETLNSVAETRFNAQEARAAALKAFAADILAVGDLLSRALAQALRLREDDALKNLVVGLQMIERDFFRISEQHGLTKLSPFCCFSQYSLMDAGIEYFSG
jgi:molecular chaperone GrpE (heat shock protein)